MGISLCVFVVCGPVGMSLLDVKSVNANSGLLIQSKHFFLISSGNCVALSFCKSLLSHGLAYAHVYVGFELQLDCKNLRL